MIYNIPGHFSSSDIINTFFEDGEICFYCNNFTNDDENFLTDILSLCLEEIGKANIYNYLKYCFKELIGNAKRANIKRIYFEEKKLDINIYDEYRKGMENFKKDINENINHYSNELDHKKYYINITFKVENENFKVIITNNSRILDLELRIANSKIKNAKEFKNIEEAFLIVQQNKEGAGLGIIITVLMMKELGLSQDAISIDRNEHETVVSITIPLSLITPSQNDIINDLIFREIDKLPKFPEHIIKIQKKLSDTEASVNDIFKLMINDPSLVADILKAVNSAELMLSNKISSLKEAIKILGFKKLITLLYAIGSQKIFSVKYNNAKMKEIWINSYKVAFYAFYIARKFLKNDIEDAYVSGIIHDIGKILLMGINPHLIEKMNLICQEKSIPLRIIEDLTSGFNHSFIGSKIAEKWNFPNNLINAIKYHETPVNVPEDHKNLIYCVNLALHLARSNSIKIVYEQLDNNVLEYFNIKDIKDLEKLLLSLNREYDKEKIKLT